MTMATLVAAGDATTNPIPSSLSPVDPFGTNDGLYTPQATWTAQAKPALVLKQPEQAFGLYFSQPRCQLDFNPSGGAAVTYTVTLWRFNRVTDTWYKPVDSPSIGMTGPQTTYLYNPGEQPWFVQLSGISAGTIQVMYDSDVMRAI